MRQRACRSEKLEERRLKKTSDGSKGGEILSGGGGEFVDVTAAATWAERSGNRGRRKDLFAGKKRPWVMI